MAYLKPQSPLQHKDGDYFYPLTTADQVILKDGSRLNTVFKHNIKINNTLLAANWSESEPYTQTIAIDESTDDYNVDVDIVYSGVKESDLALNIAASCLTYVKKNGNDITFYCLNSKPKIDIPVEITGTCRKTIANVVVVEQEGVKLNFEIIGGTSEPFDPIENTIWINTDVEITGYYFGSTEPEDVSEGKVWINTGSSSQASFNIIDNVSIYPVSARQYVSGEWIVVTAKICQNGIWESWARLPAEYQEVEYIQTTGTQWIDTGIVPDTNIYQVSTKIATTVTDQNIVLLGCGSNSYYHLTPYANKWYIGQSGGESALGSYPATVGTEYEIEFNNIEHAVVINGVVLCSNKTYTSGASIKMARRSTMSTASGGKFKYYYFKVIDNSTGKILMDLVPCYRRSDSVIGMYDIIHHNFFTNAGSDTFIAGGDI